ncbi:MAG: hypothetical protein P4M11_10075 [Candidatus Pacebacteria bacterium]|nr:hypothetical protein [Candidatus Paceibacterota bacterium]
MTELLRKQDKKFEDSVHPWWLTFKNRDHEAEFARRFESSFRLPPICLWTVYLAVAYALFYRLFAIYQLYTHNAGTKTGTMTQEFTALCIFIVAMAIEIILKLSGKLRVLRGLSIYTVLPILFTYTAFFTQKAPYFSLSYNSFLILYVRTVSAMMVVPFSTAAFLNNWRVIALANIAVSCSVTTLYLYFFSSTIPFCNFVIKRFRADGGRLAVVHRGDEHGHRVLLRLRTVVPQALLHGNARRRGSLEGYLTFDIEQTPLEGCPGLSPCRCHDSERQEGGEAHEPGNAGVRYGLGRELAAGG